MNSSTISRKPDLGALGENQMESQEAIRGHEVANGVERLFTSKEVGLILGVHPKVVERMARRGEIPALKVGKFWRYRVSKLDGWIDSQSQSSRQPCRMETSF